MRAATEGELSLLRTPGQMVELHLLTINPSVVFTAQINQTFDSTDSVVQLMYDGGSGDLALVLPGMTMYIGSTPGGYEKGMVRVRKTPTINRFYIGLTSDIDFENDDYLTVVDAFDLWPRDPTVTANTTYIDTDVPYTTQHSLREPVVAMGPMVEVLEYTGVAVTSARSAGSVTCLGSTVSGYTWSAPGASATANLDTASPTITYNSPGTYRVSCTFTADSVSFTEHRWCVVVDGANPPSSKFLLSKCSGDYDSGYWSVDVIMHADADLSVVRERALAVIYAKDWYGSTRQSIGPVTGFENIVCEGWISGETITRKWRDNTVTFRIEGPGAWLDKKSIPSTILNHTNGTPSGWNQMNGLTVDQALWHLLHYRSTATRILDIHLTGDTRLAPTLEGPAGTIWQQLRAVSEKIKAVPCCNRYGQLYVEVDSQMMPAADRATVPVVQTLTPADWVDGVDYDRITEPPISMVELSGYRFDGSTTTVLKSRAPGNSYGRSGTPDTEDDLLFSNQAQANFLAGAIYAKGNNEYPYIPVGFAGNNRLWDICPHSFAVDILSASDTLRGISSTRNLIPRTVSFEFDEDTTSLVTDVDFEAETNPRTGVTVVVEKEAENTGDTSAGVDTDFAEVPSVDLPTTDLPDWMADSGDLPGLVCRITDGYAGNGPFQLYVGTSSLTSGMYSAGMLSSWIRKASATNKSYAILDAIFEVGDSVSGPWAPQTTDDVTCTITPNNGLNADLDSSYIKYEWLVRPSANGGHGVLKATFSPPSGFNCSFYYLRPGTSVYISDTIELVGVPESIYNPGSSQAAFEMLSGIKRYGMNPPCSTSSLYWLNSQGHAAFMIVNNLNRGYGRLNLYWKNTQLNAHDGEFPTHAFGNLRTHPNALYQPALITGGVNSWFEGAYYEITGSNSVDRTWNAGTEYITIEEGVFNIYGMAHVNWKNGWMWEITKLGWQPYSGGAFGTEQVLFGNSQRYNRISVNSFQVFNVCAKE